MPIPDEIISVLKEWLDEHISDDDKRYDPVYNWVVQHQPKTDDFL